ncbi:hypothetical protein [Nannocystis pusilla]|uniref:Uncharacterized protein n=1 Tax=Nannocystis pusilla TaxID=889268 RepID=A0ABS7U052_9BACT|nr:hypothetical protein [Nannocystis pusilla]MBZ5713903.1 hypothetical protein [Nannocystis pusilla]
MRPWLALTFVAACQAGDSAATGFGPGDAVTVAPMSAGSSTGSGSSSTTSTGAETTGTSAADTSTSLPETGAPQIPDFGDHKPIGCKGKVDLLFIISRQGVMDEVQEQLLAAMPEFIDTIETELLGFDAHVMVADATGFWKMPDCSMCADPQDCDPLGEPYWCGAETDQCDQTRGAGATFPVGANATNRRCKLAGGRRYIMTKEEPDLLEAFSCLARVGTQGVEPMSFNAMIDALSPKLNGSGRCNDGFLRNDALLVVTIIHAGDSYSTGYPGEWVEALYAAKGGNRDAVQALVIAPDSHTAHPVCPDSEPGEKNPSYEFVQKMEHAIFASVCEPSYGPYFADMIAQLTELCATYIPE